MIVDVHTHLTPLDGWGPTFLEQVPNANNAAAGIDLHVTPERHWAAMAEADKAIVFGINSLALDMHTSNDSIAEYANAHSEKIIGFMSIDPHQEGAIEEIDRCVRQLGLRGIKMSPVYQHYHPCEAKAERVHRHAEKLGLPILTHAAFHSMSNTPMKWANPILYDDVAQQFPNLKIILAHVGLPWYAEAMVVARKHPNVYADVSPVFHLKWIYRALELFHEFAVIHKLLFGTDFPFSTTNRAAENLRRALQVAPETDRVPDEEVEAIIHRDALTLLGLD